MVEVEESDCELLLLAPDVLPVLFDVEDGA